MKKSILLLCVAVMPSVNAKNFFDRVPSSHKVWGGAGFVAGSITAGVCAQRAVVHYKRWKRTGDAKQKKMFWLFTALASAGGAVGLVSAGSLGHATAKEWQICRIRDQDQMLADKGDPDAQVRLGCYYLFDKHDQNITRGERNLQKAAKQGNAKGNGLLGAIYLQGYGVTRNPEKAVKHLKDAESENDVIARYNLATCYFLGIGVDEDVEKAKSYCKKLPQVYESMPLLQGFCKAIVNDDSQAQYQLAQGFEKHAPGSGFAEGMYKKAADQGHAEAQTRLQALGAQA